MLIHLDHDSLRTVLARVPARDGQFRALGFGLNLKRFSLKKRYYIVLVSRDEGGSLRKVPVPLHYAYIFVAAAVIGAFTIAGLAGSYSRMLIKTARFNQLRDDHVTLQKDYAHLEKQAHEKDVQAASLGSLATEVSALYGLTTSKFAFPMGHKGLKPESKSAGKAAVDPLIADTASNFSDDTYYKSLNTFYTLRNSAASGAATQAIGGAEPDRPRQRGGIPQERDDGNQVRRARARQQVCGCGRRTLAGRGTAQCHLVFLLDF